MDDEIAELDSHVKTLERNLAAKRRARTAMAGTEQLRHKDEDLRHSGMIRLRQAGEVGSAAGTQTAPKKRRPRKAVAKSADPPRPADKGAANP